MISLPLNNTLPVNALASSFNNTSATYKFYWFISLLEEVEKENYKIRKQDLFAGMIANAWYTINYFKLSFGKQDQLQRAVEQIIITEGLSIDERKSTITDVLKTSSTPSTVRALWYFDGEVPHRFLSPWFGSLKGNKRGVYTASQSFANNCLYAVDEQYVVINPNWIEYLTNNSGILKHFCYWNLSLYLQKHNPNVPDIPNKLVKQPKRKSLNKHRREFWDLVIDYNGPVNCIYTNRMLNIDDYAVEHFIPYAFVSHDLIWNLIPADKTFNSSKSDKLPPFDRYFEAYFKVQMLASKTIFERLPGSKFLQDYLTIVPDLGYLNSMHADDLKELFKNNIQPLITIANNNGFEFM